MRMRVMSVGLCALMIAACGSAATPSQVGTAAATLEAPTSATASNPASPLASAAPSVTPIPTLASTPVPPIQPTPQPEISSAPPQSAAVPVIDLRVVLTDLKGGNIHKDYPFVPLATLNAAFKKVSDAIKRSDEAFQVNTYEACLKAAASNQGDPGVLGGCEILILFATLEANTNPEDRNFATFAKSYIGWLTDGGFPYFKSPAGRSYLMDAIETWLTAPSNWGASQ